MEPDPPGYSVELTESAERALVAYTTWARFLRKAIDELERDPEPDGLSKFVAHANSGYSGSLLYVVEPFWIVYQLAGPSRVIIIAITPQPHRM